MTGLSTYNPKAFMYSCHCGGVSLARQFNEDRYHKMYSFADAGKE